MKHWLAHQQQALQLVIGRMLRTKLATLMILLVIGVTLSLPAGLYLLLDNLGKLAGDIDSDPQISLFMSLDTSQEALKQVDKKLHDQSEIKNFRFIPRDAAWADLKQKSGLNDLAGGLEKNPLPDAYVIHTRSHDPAVVEHLKDDMQQWSGVEHVQLDATWVKRLYSLLKVGEKAVLVLSGMLGFALLAIVGNTIRLQILTQREEIEVSQLIGATNAFIRRPFLYAGALQGLGGGIAAWLLLDIAVTLFNFSIQDVAKLYASDFHLTMLDLPTSMLLLIISTLLGWLGAYVAVSRHLTSIYQR
jgi:cell division transport system permease protein